MICGPGLQNVISDARAPGPELISHTQTQPPVEKWKNAQLWTQVASGSYKIGEFHPSTPSGPQRANQEEEGRVKG